MTIINPKSIAGVTSITTASGADNLLTVHTNNTTERIRINNDGDVIVGSGITVSPDGDILQQAYVLQQHSVDQVQV